MKFAYADPPYLGMSKFGAEHHYGKHHLEAKSYDQAWAHQELVDKLVCQFPDGWAMSLSSPSLHTILRMCPRDVRVGAWVKPFASFKPGVNPGYTWEPVIFHGGRKRGRDLPTLRDFVEAEAFDMAPAVSENITLRKGLTGAKPPKVCRWIFDWFNAEPGDELVDLFPGTGITSRTWHRYMAEKRLEARRVNAA